MNSSRERERVLAIREQNVFREVLEVFAHLIDSGKPPTKKTVVSTMARNDEHWLVLLTIDSTLLEVTKEGLIF